MMSLFDIYSGVYDEFGYLDQHVVMVMLRKVRDEVLKEIKNKILEDDYFYKRGDVENISVKTQEELEMMGLEK